ncbi:MAG: alginate export family protein [Pirellulales bacterium]|nr:alginate export family protein [Pirellulales bacterium]
MAKATWDEEAEFSSFGTVAHERFEGSAAATRGDGGMNDSLTDESAASEGPGEGVSFDTALRSEAVLQPAAPSGSKPKPHNPFAGTPPIFIFPRLGLYPVPPTGPGYYSAWDVLTDNYRQKPPPFPWGRISLKPYPLYDVDFRYLDDPQNKYHLWSDFLKRRRVGEGWLVSAGGEVRDRYMNELDSRFTTVTNRYEQLRTIAYGSAYYEDLFGVYVQFLDAQHFGEELPALPIDRDRADLSDLFVDLKLFEWDERPVYVRGGRQEIILGSQRLVSNLEWANVLRTFQGVRLFRQGEKWDATGFWLQPVIPDPSNFDSSDDRQNFTGLGTTYRSQPGRFWDLYALNLENSNQVAVGRDGRPGGTNVTTLGTRVIGDLDNTWLYDFEGMLQVGRYSNQQLQAGAVTTGGGYRFKDLSMSPQFWVYYDFASGDSNPGEGDTFGTFNQLYPFGHYYLGYLDLVARQNIQDFNVQFAFYPNKWTYVLLQYHSFHLVESRSPLFGAGGNVSRWDPTGAAGTDVGSELDLLVNFHLTAHQDILIGYSKLFAGNFIRQTGPNVSPELFYIQHQLRW